MLNRISAAISLIGLLLFYAFRKGKESEKNEQVKKDLKQTQELLKEQEENAKIIKNSHDYNFASASSELRKRKERKD